jgi:hypothetical protein
VQAVTNGAKVLATASRYLGVHEVTQNRSPQVDAWEARWRLRGVAWCGMFADAMFDEAGVDDAGLCHPSVAEMCRRARAAGAVWDGKGTVPQGALWAHCGIHVGITNAPLGGFLYSTIEGNHLDGVNTGVRDVRDALIIVPPAIREAPPVTRLYWIEDARAVPRLFGPWQDRGARDRQLARLPEARRRRARIVNRPATRQWAWIEGPRRKYGPWADPAGREVALHALQERLGHALRIYSTEV